MGLDGAAMQLYGVLDDGQAQPSAAQSAAASFVDAIEALKQAWQMLGGDARAVVGKGEVPLLYIGMSIDVDVRALACILDGIVDEVAKDAVDQ